MIYRLSRILMNAVGEPAASSAAAPAVAAPAQSPAADPAAPVVAPAQGAAPIDTSLMVRAVADGVFAELRRAGVLGKSKATETPPATAGASAPDSGRLRILDRALGQTGFASRIDDEAYQRVERNFLAESPDDAKGWVSRYFSGMGVSAAAPIVPPPAITIQPPAAAPAPAPAAPPQAQNAHPVSDGGGPPAPRQHIEDVDLIGASEADRAALLKSKGLKWYTDTLYNQLRNKSIRIR